MTLYEAGYYLGGNMPMSATIKGTTLEDIPSIIKFFKTQLKKLGVKVHLVKEITPDTILKEKPDAVVIAVGAVPGYPDVPGLDSPNVIKSTTLYNMLRFVAYILRP